MRVIRIGERSGLRLLSSLLLFACAALGVSAEPVKTCGMWRAADPVAVDETVEVTGFARADRSVLKVDGYSPRGESGEFNFQSERGAPVRIALIGLPDHWGQRFVLQSGQSVTFVAVPPFGTLVEPKSVSGGFLRLPMSRRFLLLGWDPPIRCRRIAESEVLVSANRSAGGASPREPADAGRRDGRPAAPDAAAAARVEKGARAAPPPPTATPPGLPPARLSSVVGTRAAGPPPEDLPKRTIAETLAEHHPEAAPRSLTTLKGAATPDGDATPPADAAKPTEVRVCDAGGRPLRPAGPLLEREVTVAGLRGRNPWSKGYWFDSDIAGDVVTEQDFVLEVKPSAERLLQVEIPKGRLQRLQGRDGRPDVDLLPVRFAGIESAARQFAGDKDASKSPPRITVLLFGDAATVRIAGFDAVEAEFAKLRPGFGVTIEWWDIEVDGTPVLRGRYGSFAEVLNTVRAAPASEPVLLDQDTSLLFFISGMKKRLIEAPEVDLAIWIKENYKLPFKTPEMMEDLISGVHDPASRAKIPRLPDGRTPRKWFYIYSGRIPDGSGAFIKEPLERAETPPGYFEEEESGREPRRLINRPESLARQLLTAGERLGVKSGPAPGGDDDSLVIDARESFTSLGLLLTPDGRDKLLKSLDGLKDVLAVAERDRGKDLESAVAGYKAPYDPTLLLLVRTDAGAVPRGLAYDPALRKRFTERIMTIANAAAAKDNPDPEAGDLKLLQTFTDRGGDLLRTIAKSRDARGCSHVYLSADELGLSWPSLK